MDTLARAVEDLDIGSCASEIEKVLRQVDRLEARLAHALGDLDEDQGWSVDGSLSLTAWVAWHGRRFRKDARRLAVAAAKLRSLPVTAGAWEEGRLSSAHVAAITTNVSEAHLALFASQEEELVEALSGLSAREAALAMQAWRLRAEALLDDGTGPDERPSELHVSRTMEGRAEISGHLRADDAAVVEAAIAAATTEPGPGEDRPSASERRAQALVDLCGWFLANVGRTSGARNRPQVSVIADIDDLSGGGPGRFSDGAPLDHGSLEWLSCDCELHRVLRKGRSSVLDYGASTRTISPALFSALVIRDGHCRHPGCDRGPSWCEGHHIVHYSKGGPTRLSNLVLGCARHHHLWHEQGWHLELLPDATLVLKSPWGLVLTSKPPPDVLGT